MTETTERPAEERTYEAVIGLEFHVHLATKTKMFCGCRVTYGDEPNTHTCPVCLGHPGALPVINERALELGATAGLALNCTVNERSVFARKNYFYPDLPKGYQISQYDEPICTGGYIEVPVGEGTERVGITRLHLEEDAAKNVHVGESGRMHGSTASLIDFNRGGTPLMEIVTEPDITSPEAARATANALKEVLRAVGVSEADMEKGQLRCDANVSIRNPDGSFGTKTELKNMNSFRFVERGLARELERQREILASGGRVEQATMHYDPERDEVYPLRSKEEAHDYRYFPEPDLLPALHPPEWVEGLRQRMPELPEDRRRRFESEYGLSAYDARVLASDRPLAEFYEAVAKEADPKQAANWTSGDLRALLNDSGTPVEESKVTPERLAGIIALVGDGTVSRSAAKTVLAEVFRTGEEPRAVVEREGLAQTDSDELSGILDGVIAQNPEEAERVRGGEKKVLGFLVGQAMKATRGKADGGRVREILLEKLGS
ncbi:gatB: aspartyl/glutamyl-tRNA(Asn/Gln) amidotransferase, B subunit [Rubrobacter radiotolerans]|uniref:Aspartyl/glutamyl-tRNA(Asn/Gln) amidotransferase subunit B n=1 Tax=Rubrobacter radiotolerans TaxID=42256 RepID=A0A023X0K0_RUBRA|nr:Asp-tRNA(Asn)/Glu-tRNA(Gln) amidotransferase subunit GatB [Rubrobacter radiotolerans]AHY46002.1 gatB: aspartyl/glutamyl-tRNA(Asn/Gln) amidotransferase, B subunit [Rubrobacter radiotolerans]MDX5893414.1 Asp-tRNA(Asn)/Glu-tRNA(Gln) amidotransferase subunit GatB [Rubrobacter radiotolerans]SMC03689.1 aspartyl/glutamyl-tRNA(Asn/Gln) amidotransferase subunit B [Rubrobacter radiotolerans DSM 5868]